MTTPRKFDWKIERERIDVAAVVTGLIGPSAGRRGEKTGKLWWRCPFHEDRNPSFCVSPERIGWKCFGCGASGDAASFVMKLQGVTFPEAVDYLFNDLTSSGASTTKKFAKVPSVKAKSKRQSNGLSEADAANLVEESEARLMSTIDEAALVYLTTERCLSPETIRQARLGVVSRIEIPRADGQGTFAARGIVIPWFNGDRLALVKIRQPDAFRPKYAEAFRDPSRAICYPSPAKIQPGMSLVIVEGEFDALVLGQELNGMANVVSFGSASSQPDIGVMLSAPRWYVATDGDTAGDRAAEGWPKRSQRVRPPGPFKDWSEAKSAGINLRRWWLEVLTGNPRPPLYSWEELRVMRWGPAINDPIPGIDVQSAIVSNKSSLDS